MVRCMQKITQFNHHHPWLECLLLKIPCLQKLPTHFIFFAFFGGLATVIDWTLFYFTHFKLGWYYQSSVTLTFIIGTLISFLGNRYLNFCDTSKKILSQYGLFISLALVGLFLTYGLMFVFINQLKLHAMLARILATFLVLFYNYNSQKHITFRPSQKVE